MGTGRERIVLPISPAVSKLDNFDQLWVVQREGSPPGHFVLLNGIVSAYRNLATQFASGQAFFSNCVGLLTRAACKLLEKLLRLHAYPSHL